MESNIRRDRIGDAAKTLWGCSFDIALVPDFVGRRRKRWRFRAAKPNLELVNVRTSVSRFQAGAEL